MRKLRPRETAHLNRMLKLFANATIRRMRRNMKYFTCETKNFISALCLRNLEIWIVLSPTQTLLTSPFPTARKFLLSKHLGARSGPSQCWKLHSDPSHANGHHYGLHADRIFKSGETTTVGELPLP